MDKHLKASELNEFFACLSSRCRRVAKAMRAVVRQTIPKCEESIAWGALSYHRPEVGGHVKGAVCMIGVKGDQVRLDFIHGIRLTDPQGLLHGNQISKRFVMIDSEEDAKRPEIIALIREAAELDPNTWRE